MTEHPSNQNHQNHHKSRLPQLNHNSPRHHSQQQQLQIKKQHEQQPQTQKRPLTTSPNTTYNYYGYPNFRYQPSLPNTYATGLLYNGGGSSSSIVSSSRSSYNEDESDELTDESLKRNVEIVLKNLNRYNNVLQSIKLPSDSSDSLNYSFGDLSFTVNNNNNFNLASMANIMSSPESDYNSNPPHLSPFGGGHLNCSIASSHDFTHDNSDYQWFLDYGYREGGVQHQSILSSLSASYNGIGELSYYEDLAKNIDANLAEVDMESFRAEDIHSFLTHIPTFCKDKRRQADAEIDNSICKSELLFSPVKESHISVDSLDLDSLMIDDDIIITCKGNKDNYTIAFEESAMYSDESFYAEIGDPHSKVKQNYINLHSNLDDIVKRKSLEVSMSRSDHAFTTWSKLKKNSTSQLQRYPSGNNNTSVNVITRHAPHCAVRKSSSLPNLQLKKDSCHENPCQAVSTSTVDSFKSRNLLPMCQMPISSTSIGESPLHHESLSNVQSTDSSKSNTSTSAKPQNQPAFNLVKLFIKQKSGSSDTCMDVSSGCWPSDASSSSEMRTRKKSMNDSGKGSALSRHDEEDMNNVGDSSYQLDSLDVCEQNRKDEGDETGMPGSTATSTPKKMRNDLYREVFDSPAHRNHNMECNMNIRNQPLKNHQVYNLSGKNNNNNSMERDSLSKDYTNKSVSDTSRTSENVTQIYNLSHSRMKIPVHTITRSMQTSLVKDRFKLVPPSFLAQLHKLGEQKTAPIYVIYPNYALPNLDFVKNNLNVILSPLNYKEAITTKKQRPTSITKSQEEALSHIDYDQVQDWKSLATLLPVEYRKRLKHIPEADVALDPTSSQKPLFCMTPPLRRNAKANMCDCASFFQQTTCTSSSGSSQQPSSGYRGSSTLLTDSEFETAIAIGSGDQMKTAHQRQYEINKLESEVIDRPPPSGRAKRGILRRNTSGNRAKRNSMFEETCTSSNVKTLEKRRSLQEQYYLAEDHNIIQDYLAELEEDSKAKQYYADLQAKLQQNMIDDDNIMESNAFERTLRREDDLDARIRAENFLANVPKSELKYYAEIANILEAADITSAPYDAAKLKNEVSRALSQKKVSFNNGSGDMNYLTTGHPQKFSTPPNSPNISMAALRMNSNTQRPNELRREMSNVVAAEKQKQDKISSNRFKRLQIQWELLSKDSSLLLKDLAREKETKSGGSTPTSSGGSHRSRIPRPVSYPAMKSTPEQAPKALRSPSKLVPPKKYSMQAIPTAVAQTNASPVPGGATNVTPSPRTPSRLQTTPKKRVQSPKSATRTR